MACLLSGSRNSDPAWLAMSEQEAMRKYPAGGVATFRMSKTGKEVVLGGGKVVVPPGVGLHMPITALHHSAALWENPEDFIPERFLKVWAPHTTTAVHRFRVCSSLL